MAEGKTIIIMTDYLAIKCKLEAMDTFGATAFILDIDSGLSRGTIDFEKCKLRFRYLSREGYNMYEFIPVKNVDE